MVRVAVVVIAMAVVVAVIAMAMAVRVAMVVRVAAMVVAVAVVATVTRTGHDGLRLTAHHCTLTVCPTTSGRGNARNMKRIRMLRDRPAESPPASPRYRLWG